MATNLLPLLQLLAQLSSVDVGEDARHLLDQLVTVDDLGGIGIEGGALDVGGEKPAVAVENVGPVHRGGDVVEAPCPRLHGGEAEAHQPPRNGEEAQRKGEAGQAIAVAALRQSGPFGRRSRGAHMKIAGQASAYSSGGETVTGGGITAGAA